jgi:tRNA (cytidine/uridine-2'-O-)-methyltransferase
MPVHVILFQPEIPPNTGNIIRLCANTGARLHLIRPLGFRLDAKAVRRAGLDYHELAEVRDYPDLQACCEALGQPRWFAFTTRGMLSHDQVKYADGDALVFGPETRGLPEDVLELCPPERRVRIPMLEGARSLNLSNAVAVAVYEAWRQQEWKGTGDRGQ